MFGNKSGQGDGQDSPSQASFFFHAEWHDSPGMPSQTPPCSTFAPQSPHVQ
ncbi:hypothetical protein ACFOGG_13085 [Brenneria rubrifaciens]|uniref:hypothetical protein n=1 Tax=Brenneria rubrifaciens TaxID=55213 RepID=UPI00360983B2